MAERSSNRQRKLVIPFDEIVHQSAKPAKLRKPRIRSLKALEPHHGPAPAESSNNEVIQEDPVQLLASRPKALTYKLALLMILCTKLQKKLK